MSDHCGAARSRRMHGWCAFSKQGQKKHKNGLEE
jgi:hypothetical protein